MNRLIEDEDHVLQWKYLLNLHNFQEEEEKFYSGNKLGKLLISYNKNHKG